MEQAPSSGKTTAIASLSTGQAIVLLLYVVHKFGIDDMTPEVATAIISFAGLVAGALMHTFQRKQERAEDAKPNHGHGVNAAPQP